MSNLIKNITMPDGGEYKLPGISHESTSIANTPNIGKFYDGTTATLGTLEPSKDTLGEIYVVPSEPVGKGGSVVDWSQIVTSGKHIADVTVDGVKTEVYAPEGGGTGGSTVKWVQETLTDPKTKIASIEIDNVSKDVYAPNGALYTMTQDATNGHIVKLSKNGTVQDTITIPDNNTTNTTLAQEDTTTGVKLTLTDSDGNNVNTTVVQKVYAENSTIDNYYPVLSSKENGSTAYATATSGQTEGVMSGNVRINPSTGDMALKTLTIGDGTNSWNINVDATGNMLIV